MCHLGALYKHILVYMMTRICNYTLCFVWDVITHPYLNFNGSQDIGKSLHPALYMKKILSVSDIPIAFGLNLYRENYESCYAYSMRITQRITNQQEVSVWNVLDWYSSIIAFVYRHHKFLTENYNLHITKTYTINNYITMKGQISVTLTKLNHFFMECTCWFVFML